MTHSRCIERVRYVSKRHFDQEIRPKNKPVIITNALHHWKASAAWSFAFFYDNYGSVVVSCEVGHLFECTLVTRCGNIKAVKRVNCELKQFIDAILDPDQPEDLYLTEWRIFEQIPELQNHVDLDRLDIYSRVFTAPVRVYMGKAGAFTPIHLDRAPNFTAHIVGKKRWTLFPPEQLKYLYFFPWYGQLSHFSRVNNLEKMKDFQMFPEMQNVTPIECIVNEGEILYIPEGWPHHVSSIEPSISIHFFWKTFPLYLRQILSAPMNFIIGGQVASTVKVDPSKLVVLKQFCT